MDMQPPPAYPLSAYVELAQAKREPLGLLPAIPPPSVAAPAAPAAPVAPGEPPAPVEPTAIKVDVSPYVPEAATSATIILSLTPSTGQALVYSEGSENNGTVFKGARSVGDIQLDGPYIYVKLYGATSFHIQY